MVNISVKEKNNYFDSAGEKVTQAVTDVIKNAILTIEAGAKANCPVDTGNLRASINSRMENESTGAVGTNVEYAAYVEYGTYKQAAQPFLFPAYAAEKDRIAQEIKNAIGGTK